MPGDPRGAGRGSVERLAGHSAFRRLRPAARWVSRSPAVPPLLHPPPPDRRQRPRITDLPAFVAGYLLPLLAFMALAPLAVAVEAAVGSALGELRYRPNAAAGCWLCHRSCRNAHPQPPTAAVHRLRAGALYKQRAAGSSGIALGALALPCVLAGLAAKQQKEQQAGCSGLLLACTAASAASLASLLWRAQHGGGISKGLQQNGSKRRQASSGRAGSNSSSAATKPGARAGPWLLWALVAVVALAAVAAAISDGLPNAATLLAAAAVAAGCQHALLVGLPGVFTAGEAMVAAEAAVLLLGSALQSLQQGAGAAQQQAGSYTLFVLLLTAGSVAAAALLFPLLLSRQRAAVHKPGSRHRTAHGAAAAAAVVALLAAVAAVPAALWAVRLALSSRRRLLVCGWWAGALGAALPIMGWLSGSGRMRGILGEVLWERGLVTFYDRVLVDCADACAGGQCPSSPCTPLRLLRYPCLHDPSLPLPSAFLPTSAQGLPPAGSGSLPARPAGGATAAGRGTGCRLGGAAGGGGCPPVRPAWHL